MMSDEQKYNAVLKELGEVLQEKNTTISCQKWQIDNLKEKLAAAEKERDEAIGECVEANNDAMVASKAFAQLRAINVALRDSVDLKNGIILDASVLVNAQNVIQEVLQQAEGGAA